MTDTRCIAVSTVPFRELHIEVFACSWLYACLHGRNGYLWLDQADACERKEKNEKSAPLGAMMEAFIPRNSPRLLL